MKMTLIPIVNGVHLEQSLRALGKKLKELKTRVWIETILTTAFFRSARIGKESWRLQEAFCHSDSYERSPANVGVKNSNEHNNNYSNPLGIMQEIETWPYYQMVYALSRICPGEWDV